MHFGEELVNPRAALVVGAAVPPPAVAHRPVGQRGVLGDEVDDIHSETVHSAVHPPAHHLVDGTADLGILPVEFGLLRGEHMQVVLAAGRVVFPSGTTEYRTPIVRLRSRAPRFESLAGGPPPVPVP